jgi:hypothetical protein
MLLKKALFLILPILLTVSLNLFFLEEINKFLIYPNRFKHNVFPTINERFDYVVVGHSHGRDSFNFELIENNGINLSFSSQNLYWSKNLLEKYESYFHEGTTIIIEVSFNTFCQEESFGNVRYVNLGFDRKQVRLTLTDYIVSKYLPLLGINGLNILINPTRHFADRDFDFDSTEDLELNSISYLENLIESEMCSKEILDYNIGIIEDIILEQQKRNRAVVLYSAPIYISVSGTNSFDESNKVISSNFIIDNLSEVYNLKYLDFYKRSNISSNPQYFRNANHLNNLGSSIFMQFFFDELQSE